MLNNWSLVAVASMVAASPALAWNDYGHELIASIAYRDLKPEVKARVDAILKEHVQYAQLSAGCPQGFDQGEWVFMRAATWPDMIRSANNPHNKTEHHPKWHYINFPIEQDGEKGPQPKTEWKAGSDPENAVQALAKCEAGLKDAKATDAQKAKDLSWFLHLVGDLHQPLHATNLHSKQFPKGDQGGNAFWVTNAGGQPMKLHALWDQALGTGKDLKKIADRGMGLVIRKEMTRSSMTTKLATTAYADWAKESFELARATVYLEGKLKGVPGSDNEKPRNAPQTPPKYFDNAEKLAEQQVVLAGYRLADQINTNVK